MFYYKDIILYFPQPCYYIYYSIFRLFTKCYMYTCIKIK